MNTFELRIIPRNSIHYSHLISVGRKKGGIQICSTWWPYFTGTRGNSAFFITLALKGLIWLSAPAQFYCTHSFIVEYIFAATPCCVRTWITPWAPNFWQWLVGWRANKKQIRRQRTIEFYRYAHSCPGTIGREAISSRKTPSFQKERQK